MAPSRFETFTILFSLWLMVFAAASQVIVVTPILPIIGEALDIPEARRGWIVTGYAVALAAGALVTGPFSDRFGRRVVLLAGTGTMTLALVLHGLADSFAAMVAVRTLAGLCGGMLSGAAVSYVGDFFPYERRGRATGVVMSGTAFGLVFGVPLGRVLAASSGFRVPFLVFAAAMAVVFVLIWTRVPQPDVEFDDERITVFGTLRRYRDLLRDGPVRAAVLTYFLMYLSLSLLVVYLPQWITNEYPLAVSLFGRPLVIAGLQIDFIATLFTVGGAASVVLGPAAGSLSDVFGRKPLILISCLGLAVVVAAMTHVVGPRWMVYPFYLAFMSLFALRMAPLQALLTALVPDRRRGSLLAFAIALGQFGLGVGASIAGPLYAGLGYGACTYASALTVLLMAGLVWRYLPEPTGDAQPLPAAAPVAAESDPI
ncbi:MAG: MFS transporter [Rhodothermales bacterium]|nr:MFS transporter [Rhodothermales bacterium]